MRTDGAEDVGPFVALVARRARPRSTPSPDAGQRALLADARLVLEPDFNGLIFGMVGEPRDQRYEWAYIFGAVCPQRRATAALVVPAANTEVMSLHLAEIGRQVAPGSHAALVLDGAGYHVAKDLAVPHNITLVPLPPYAPELNPIENVWEYLRGNKLAITVFDSYDDILDKACDAWTFFANDQNRIASITTRSWATVIL